MEPIGYGLRQALLATEAPAEPAVTLVSDHGEQTITRLMLMGDVTRLAGWLDTLGVGRGSWVVIALPNGLLHLALALAAWRLGATVLPLNPRLAPREAAALVALSDPAVIVADWSLDHPRLVRSAEARRADNGSHAMLADPIPEPGKAIASGGSTGRPKIIVDPNPWVATPGDLVRRYGPYVGVREGQRQLVAGPLYHNAPFLWAHYGLFERHHLIMMDRFDAARALDAIERFRIEWVMLVPTMMLRMLREQRARPRDLSSLEAVYHTAAACPPWVKEGWIELVGPIRVFEGYGSTEGVGACLIRGDDWLAHRGSVGRALHCRLEIRDAEGRVLPSGQVGEVFFRSDDPTPTYRYVGLEPAAAPDGFASVGDLGWLDADGYLYLADRRTDLIVTGGVNVYPAEVETVLSEHPAIRDVAVIGLPDGEWGHRVHAILEPADHAAPPSPADLAAWCRSRLSPPKIPKTFEIVSRLPRDEAGKIRRSSLRAERST